MAEAAEGYSQVKCKIISKVGMQASEPKSGNNTHDVFVPAQGTCLQKIMVVLSGMLGLPPMTHDTLIKYPTAHCYPTAPWRSDLCVVLRTQPTC